MFRITTLGSPLGWVQGAGIDWHCSARQESSNKTLLGALCKALEEWQEDFNWRRTIFSIGKTDADGILAEKEGEQDGGLRSQIQRQGLRASLRKLGAQATIGFGQNSAPPSPFYKNTFSASRLTTYFSNLISMATTFLA